MERIQNFKELRIWQKGIEIVNDIYSCTKLFPKEEIYGLTSQMRRSAISIPSNIAEGYKRFHKKEFKQFLHISLGSAAELETQLIISQKQDYLSNEQLIMLSENINHLSKMINAFLRNYK